MELDSSLSDNIPAVSVSLRFGEYLKRKGKHIDINPEILGSVLLAQDVPPEQMSNVSLVVDLPQKLFRRGEAWTDYERGGYGIALFPSFLQRCGFRTGKLQSTVVHEAQHVGDFVGERFLELPEHHKRYFRNVDARKHLGVAACTVISFYMLPVTTEHVAVPILERAYEHNNEFLFGLAITTPFYSVFTAFMLSRVVFKRFQKLERRANRTARKTAANYPQIISIEENG